MLKQGKKNTEIASTIGKDISYQQGNLTGKKIKEVVSMAMIWLTGNMPNARKKNPNIYDLPSKYRTM